MKRSHVIFGILIILVVGYAAYSYVVRRPPDFLIKLVAGNPPPPELPAGDEAPFDVPEGFQIHIFSRDTPGARVMTHAPEGGLLVSSTREGKIFWVGNRDQTPEADEVTTVLDGLRQPHGLYVVCGELGEPPCTLYVAETHALASYAYDEKTHTATNRRVLTEFPSGAGHYTRTILPHPDGERLLMSVGSSCNVCNETDERRASVVAYNMETGTTSIFARGLRNSVFMALHPVTGEVWATDNGRDLIGDNIPPDEINIIREGENYGWPICYGRNVHDTAFDPGGADDACAAFEPSHVDLQAHSAALGIVFVPEEGWPEEYWHDAIVAYHGSWNRSEPTGYKVVRINLSPEGAPQGGAPQNFITGFLTGPEEDDALGRPAGLLIEPGGTMYVSDDHAGAIYRVTRTGDAP